MLSAITQAFRTAIAGALAMGVLLAAAGMPRAQVAAPPAKELVAVLDLDRLGASKNQAAAVSDRLREALLATGNYRLVDRNEVNKVLDEQALQQTGCTSQECAVQVGRILGVRKLVTGKLNRVQEGLWLVSCTMIDAESAEIVRAASVQHQGDFASLLAVGAPQLIAKLTGASAPDAAPANTAAGAAQPVPDATLQVAQVPTDARVFLNGTEKGNGPQNFTQLAPGPYDLMVRRAGFHMFKQAVTLAPGQAVKVVPKFDPLRVAIFPIERTGTWSSNDSEAYTAGWVTRAIKKALDQAKLTAAYTMHTDDRRLRTKVGKDLHDQPDVGENAWSVFGNPNIDFAMKKGRALDVDAVLFVSVNRGGSAKIGSWKAKLVDVRNTTVTDDSGSFPLGPKSGTGVADGLGPLLQRYVESAR